MVSNFRDANLITSKNVAQPSDFSAFGFHENTLAASYSVKVHILIVFGQKMGQMLIIRHLRS